MVCHNVQIAVLLGTFGLSHVLLCTSCNFLLNALCTLYTLMCLNGRDYDWAHPHKLLSSTGTIVLPEKV